MSHCVVEMGARKRGEEVEEVAEDQIYVGTQGIIIQKLKINYRGEEFSGTNGGLLDPENGTRNKARESEGPQSVVPHYYSLDNHNYTLFPLRTPRYVVVSQEATEWAMAGGRWTPEAILGFPHPAVPVDRPLLN